MVILYRGTQLFRPNKIELAFFFVRRIESRKAVSCLRYLALKRWI